MKIKRGDIYFCELHGIGSVQKKGRPCVVVSNNKANTFSSVITVAPITSKIKNNLPTHVIIELSVMSCIMLEQITTIDKIQVREKIGKCDDDTIGKIETAMLIQLGIGESVTRRENRILKKKLLEYKKLLIKNSVIGLEEETDKQYLLKRKE